MEGTILDSGAEPGGSVRMDERPAAPPESPSRPARPLWRVAAVIGVLAFVVRVWAPGPVTQTMDEFAWYMCSRVFHDAVADGNLTNASTSAITGPKMTQPGVTTMWAGTIGFWAVEAGESLGLVHDEPGDIHAKVAHNLRAGRSVVSLWCAIALAALVMIAAKLIGRRAAVVAGVLLAAEPFLVGHSHVLHTDAMVTMFGALAVVSLAAAIRDRDGPVDRKLVAVAGVAAGLAALTKLNGIPLVLGGAAAALAIQTDWRRATRAGSLRRTVPVGLAFLGVAIATFFVAFPALWVNPLSELQRLPGGLQQLGQENYTYFRYRVSAEPGLRYYPYALAFRLSPWLMVTGLASAVAAVVHLLRRAGRAPDRRSGDGPTPWPAPSVLAFLLLAPVPYAVLISFTGQKYDRYALPLVPYLALLAGVGVAVATERWSERPGHRLLVPAGLALAATIFAVTVAIQPYAISFANPLVGGQKRARGNILLGWGEGYEVLGKEIKRREHGRCDDVKILTSNPLATFVALPCGRLVPFDEAGPGTYVIRYISTIQRSPNDPVDRDVVRRGTLIKEVDIYGVTYADLWQYPD